MMYDDAGWGWWMMALFVLGGLVVVAVTVAVVLAARPRAGQGSSATGSASAPGGGRTPPSLPAALAELDLRFARGEIDEDTYRRSRDVLNRPPGW